MTIILVVLAALVGLFLLDRLLLWMEWNGWIYYRRSEGSGGSGSIGNAFLNLQTMLDPGKRHVLEARQEMRAEQRESGDPPESGEE